MISVVENIALIPWLLLLGALHLSHKKNTLNFKTLIFLSFAFSFLGVFTVRMGLIRSIHNFTQNFDSLWFLIVTPNSSRTIPSLSI
jgi:cytochrome c biogenesis factor